MSIEKRHSHHGGSDKGHSELHDECLSWVVCVGGEMRPARSDCLEGRRGVVRVGGWVMLRGDDVRGWVRGRLVRPALSLGGWAVDGCVGEGKKWEKPQRRPSFVPLWVPVLPKHNTSSMLPACLEQHCASPPTSRNFATSSQVPVPDPHFTDECTSCCFKTWLWAFLAHQSHAAALSKPR